MILPTEGDNRPEPDGMVGARSALRRHGQGLVHL